MCPFHNSSAFVSVLFTNINFFDFVFNVENHATILSVCNLKVYQEYFSRGMDTMLLSLNNDIDECYSDKIGFCAIHLLI